MSNLICNAPSLAPKLRMAKSFLVREAYRKSSSLSNSVDVCAISVAVTSIKCSNEGMVWNIQMPSIRNTPKIMFKHNTLEGNSLKLLYVVMIVEHETKCASR